MGKETKCSLKSTPTDNSAPQVTRLGCDTHTHSEYSEPECCGSMLMSEHSQTHKSEFLIKIQKIPS